VCADLENEGYEVTPYLLPASGKNAPHRRNRIWFVAYRKDIRCGGAKEVERERGKHKPNNRGKVRGTFNANGSFRTASDTVCKGHKRSELNGTFDKGNGSRESSKSITELCEVPNWEEFPTQPPICGRDDGVPKELDGITFPKWRKESIKAYGNAIVPQVAHEIFKAIQKMEDTFVP
jgi:DNA (cytosine-5)-methyltransferase 1